MRTRQHTESLRMAPRTGMCIGLCFAAILGGCSSRDLNARPVLAGAHEVPAITPDNQADRLPPLTGVALRRVDRADWAPIEYLAPFDGVVHAPVWRGHARHHTNQPRAAGVAPTIETALDLPQDQGWHAVTDTLGAHGIAILDVALLPVRAIIEWPTARQISPGILYKRTTPGRWVAGPKPDSDAEPIDPERDNG